MEGRGRKSAASLEVVQHSGITAVVRPEPPHELTDEQAHEWRAVVNRLPAEWFPRETHGSLAQYCRHVVTAGRVAQLIGAMEAQEDFAVDEYDKLLKMQDRESRAIAALS